MDTLLAIRQHGNYQFRLYRTDSGFRHEPIMDGGKHMAWIDGKMWDVDGKEPTEAELEARMHEYLAEGKHNPQIGHRLACECCDHTNTRWLRGQYWICYDCGIAWENTPVYDVAAYESDSRMEER